MQESAERRRVKASARCAIAFALALASGAAWAHSEADAHVAMTGWHVRADITIALGVAAVIYAAGMWRQRGRQSAASRAKHAAFFSGLAALFIALASPLDALADHLFFMHQVQHLLLQTVAPMLLMLAAPQALLIAGMPELSRRRLLAPLMSSIAVRGVFGLLTRPWMAALLLVASMYVWQWPPYHDFAVRNVVAHYVMHVTMLAAGLLFYACVFDPRPAPLGARYGTRIGVLLFTMTANMLLGAGLALKEHALYSVYDRAGWSAISALADERLGGLIVWIPGSALCVPAFLVLLRMWNARESRLDDRRSRGIVAAAPVARAVHHRVAYWLAFGAAAAFAGTIGIGLIAMGNRF